MHLQISDGSRIFDFMNIQSDVCIVGGGAIGKAAALGCAQLGLKVTLLAPSIPTQMPLGLHPDRWDARVYAINRAARALLSSLRVWDAMDASRIALVDAMDIKGDGIKHTGNLHFDAYSARVDALAWIVEDVNLNQALNAALKFAPGIRVVAGQGTQLNSNAGDVTVVLENGETISSALLIGADGGHSWVRYRCDIGFDYRSYNQRAVVSNFSCQYPHHGVAYQWFAATEGIIALLPLPGQRVSLVWSAPENLAETLMHEPLDQLAHRLSQMPGHRLGHLHPLDPHDKREFPLAMIRPHRIIAPRVALVGDAAHVVHPLAGHGMNLGFSDVAELLKALGERAPQQGCGDARILGRYARARQEDILLMQHTIDGLERLFATDFEPLRIARNIGLNLVNRVPVIKRQLMSHALGKMQ